ncbi:MAG: PRC-barrel domain-containing protein [Endomicrobiales bacterium]|nr:PRC-barrel domain-containing protein [Endomicrobiales bacterium]
MWKVEDIAGSEVFELSGEKLGILIDVLPTGSNDVWVVKTFLDHPEEYLIPALKEVIREVDAENKKIVVNLPPGLKEVYITR